jgi:hypothetical protein
MNISEIKSDEMIPSRFSHTSSQLAGLRHCGARIEHASAWSKTEWLRAADIVPVSCIAGQLLSERT